MTAISPLIGPGTVDIPPALRSLAAYTASLAHKTNHSFVPNCEFDEFHHPRYTIYTLSYSLSTQNIYTISTVLHRIYTVSTRYLHSIYSVSTQYLPSIYTPP